MLTYQEGINNRIQVLYVLHDLRLIGGREKIPYVTERISDVARVLSRYGDAIAIRIYGESVNWIYGKGNQIVREFAKWADVPVINMECDMFHPCQALADALTIKEKLKTLEGKKVVVSWAYSGG